MEEKDRDPELQKIVVECIKDLVSNDYTVGVTLERFVYESLEKAHRLGWNDCFDDLKGKGRND